MINWKKVACLLLASMLVSQSVVTDSGLQIVKAAEETEPTATEASEEVLEIATVKEFEAFADRVRSGETFEGKTVRLVNDIEFDGATVNNFQGIGSTFKGIFDGNGHTIKGIIMIGNSAYLFNKLSYAKIHDLTLENCEFNSSYAAVISNAENSEVYNCNLQNCKINGFGFIKTVSESNIYNCAMNNCTMEGEGFINSAYNSNIYNSTISNCTIEGSSVAGFVYNASKTNIYNCRLEGCAVAGSFSAAGIALSAEYCNIRNCVNDSNVKGTTRAVGLIGRAYQCNLYNDINMGSVCAEQFTSADGTTYSCAAGLIGAMSGGSISNCANQADIKGQYSEIDSYQFYHGDEYDEDYYDESDYDDGDWDCYSLPKIHKMQNTAGTVNALYDYDDNDYTPSPEPTSTPEPGKFCVNVGGLIGEVYKVANKYNNEYDDEYDDEYETETIYIQNCYQTGKITLDARASEKTGAKGEAKELIELIGTVNSNAQEQYSLNKYRYVAAQQISVVLSNCYFLTAEGETTKTGVYDGTSTNRNLIAKDVKEMKTAAFLNTLNHNRGVNKDWTRWKMTASYPVHASVHPICINGSLYSTYEADTELTLTVTPNDLVTPTPSTATPTTVETTPEPILGSVTINDGKVSLIDHGNYIYSFLMPNETANIVYTGKNIDLSAELPDIPDATEQPEATPTPEPSLTPAPTTTVPAPTDINLTTAEPTAPAINETNTSTPTVPTTVPTADAAKEPVVDPINKTLVLYVGGNTQNTKSYQVKVTNIADYELSYESSKKSVATVSANGKITAKKAGTAKIYVNVKDKTSGKSSSFVLANVTVKKAGLSFTKKVSTLKVGKKATFNVKKNGVKGTVKWTVSNKKLASVTSKGVLKGKKAGKVKVTATCGKKKVTATVTIKK